jgi:hypothetical protein
MTISDADMSRSLVPVRIGLALADMSGFGTLLPSRERSAKEVFEAMSD